MLKMIIMIMKIMIIKVTDEEISEGNNSVLVTEILYKKLNTAML